MINFDARPRKIKPGDKYTLTNNKITFSGHTLYRIRALKTFADVKAGDLGGYVESEYNLSHNSNCWVYDDAKVYGEVFVKDNAQIRNNAVVTGEL